MKEFKGSPAPWKADLDDDNERYVVYLNEGVQPHIAYTPDWSTSETNKANAILIAAAPDLLEALQVAVKAYKDKGWNSNYPPLKQVEAAINKALSINN